MSAEKKSGDICFSFSADTKKKHYYRQYHVTLISDILSPVNIIYLGQHETLVVHKWLKMF